MREIAEQVQGAIPVAKDQIYRAFMEWYDALTGGDYPLADGATPYTMSQHRVTSIYDANSKLFKFLDDLRENCICERVKYWKR